MSRDSEKSLTEVEGDVAVEEADGEGKAGYAASADGDGEGFGG